MKKLILIVMFFTSTIAFSQHTEERSVDDFTKVSMGISGDLVIKQGNQNSLVLKGDKETLDKIVTEVSNNNLKIKTKNGRWYKSYSNVTVFITVVDLDAVTLGGSGNIKSDGKINCQSLDLAVSGSGNIEMNVEVNNNIDLSISGSGKIYLTGSSKEGELSISGSGKLDALDMTSEAFDIRISGSGSAKINVSKSIVANISGSGSVQYSGNPEKVSSHASGSGSIKKI